MNSGRTDTGSQQGTDDRDRAIELYETIVNTVADGIYQLDLEGRFVAVNDIVVTVTGYSREELLGEHVSLLLPDGDISAMAADIREMLGAESPRPRTHESTVTTADDGPIPVEIRFDLLREGEEATGTVGVVRDISDRKERERRLRRQRDELSHELDEVLGRVSDAVFALDADWRFAYVNAQAQQRLERTEAELLGRVIWDEFPEMVGTRFQAEYERAMETGDPTTFEAADPRLDTWFEVHAYPSETGLSVYFRDVTERKERERELQRYETIVETVRDGVYVLDEDSRFALVNDAYCELTGYDREELLGAHSSRVVDEDVTTRATERAQELAAGADVDARIEADIHRADGESVPVESVFTVVPPADGEYRGRVGIVRDVTEQKAREEQLRRERDRFTTLFESIPEPVVHVRFEDGDPIVRNVNPAFEGTFGHGATAAVGESLNELVVPDRFREEAAEIDRRAADLGGTHGEVRRRTADGERDFLFSGVPVEVEGAVEGIGVYVDITERKERERELEQYRALTQGANDVIVTIDGTSTIQSVNPAVRDVFGYAPEALVGESLSQLVPDELEDGHAAGLRRYLRTGERHLDWEYVEITGKHRDGSDIPLAMSFSDVEYGGRQFFTGIIRDVTERTRRERQQEALADLGRLALETDDLDDLFDATVERVAAVLDHDYCRVLELRPGEASLRLRNGVGWQEGYVGEATVGAEDASPAGYTLRSAEPVVVADLSTEARFSAPDLLAEHDVTSGISVAIGPTSDPWGVLGTHDTRRHEYDEHDVAFVHGVANVLATAIAHRQHERTLARQRTELEDRERTLRRTYEVVTDPDRSVRSRIQAILGVLREAVGVDYAALTRTQDDECTYEVVDAAGDAAIQAGETVPLAETDCERVVARGETIVLRDVERDAPELAARPGNLDRPISAYVGVPVSVGGEVYGSFCFYDTVARADGFSEWEVALVELFGNWLGQELDRQQYVDRLGALNDLNGVVREINEALIRESTREEMEQLVCEQLAASDSYTVAWIGEVEPRGETVRLRAEAGVSDFLEDLELSIDPAHPTSDGPTARALRTGEIQVVRDVQDDPGYARWRERADAYGYRASAAIPITFEGTIYGVLNVYADRRRAFGGEERDVVGHLGETIGHALGAIERKRALASDEVVELEFQIEQLLDSVGVEDPGAGAVTFDRTITLGDDDHLVYGTATGAGVETLRALVARLDTWDDLSVVDERFGEARFELQLSRTPVISIAVEHNGFVERARIDDGDFSLVVQLPPSADVRAVSEAVQGAYPELDIVAQRRASRVEDRPVRRTLGEDLTDRQRTALEAAYFAGFFEWPRGSTGEEVAASLGVSPATFHEHVRNGERKLLASLLGDTGTTA